MSDETPKQLAERRLREMVSGACDVVEQSIKVGAARNQQTRSADAWAVINAVLKAPDAKPAQKPEVSLTDTPVDVVSEKLRLVKQTERRQR